MLALAAGVRRAWVTSPEVPWSDERPSPPGPRAERMSGAPQLWRSRS
jgi:hypothetical protein